MLTTQFLPWGHGVRSGKLSAKSHDISKSNAHHPPLPDALCSSAVLRGSSYSHGTDAAMSTILSPGHFIVDFMIVVASAL